MSWSWKLGRIAAIDVYVHFTFFLLLGWEALRDYQAHGDTAETISGLVFILILFGIVVLHELGHALAARSYGIRTRDIMLLPIGGVARLERMPRDPGQELVVALAGPAVNVVLAVVIYLVLALGRGLSSFGEALQVGGGFLDRLFWVNVSLAIFNLLPAFPMDGGPGPPRRAGDATRLRPCHPGGRHDRPGCGDPVRGPGLRLRSAADLHRSLRLVRGGPGSEPSAGEPGLGRRSSGQTGRRFGPAINPFGLSRLILTRRITR